MAVGYSGTPTPKKLGLKPSMKLAVLDAPAAYDSIVGELPQGLSWSATVTKNTDLVHVFATSRSALSVHLTKLRKSLRDEVAVWVSWPKKAAKVETDITEDTIRELALPLGFLEIK